MSERIGQELNDDRSILTYARGLWVSPDYRSWREHMRRDVEEGLKSDSQRIEDFLEEA